VHFDFLQHGLLRGDHTDRLSVIGRSIGRVAQSKVARRVPIVKRRQAEEGALVVTLGSSIVCRKNWAVL